MTSGLQAYRDIELHLPVRIRIAVPPEGLGSQLDQMVAWLDANCGPGSWSMTPSGACGVTRLPSTFSIPLLRVLSSIDGALVF
jgi:hypothetical protein